MSFATDLTAKLHQAARETYATTLPAGRALASAHKAVTQSTDYVEVLGNLIDMVVAVEDLHDQAEATAKRLRAAMAEAMGEAGCPAIASGYHTAHLARKPAFVSVNDEAAIPADYVVQRPSIDKKAIAAAIKAGTEVPGASLMTPNEQTLVIRAKKEAPV